MNPELLQDAIGNIDDVFVEEAARATILPPKIWMPAAALAACALLTVALLPWKTILDPAVQPPGTNTATDVLHHKDTSHPDTTKEKEDSLLNDTTENTQPSPEDTLYDSTQNGAQSPDPSEKEDTNGSYTSPDTQDPYLNSPEKPVPKDTTAPLVPDEPNTPVVPIPQGPTVLSYSQYPVQDQYPAELSLRPMWRSARNEMLATYQSGIGNTDSFMSLTLYEFFSDSENENLIYSPVNTYMSLGMLAEAASGASRQQVLSLLEKNDIYSLRESAKSLWNSCYRDDGIVTTVLANSLWLDNSFTPNTAVADILSESYYASSFYGNMGDDEYDTLMRSWINEQTKGVLENTVSGESLDPESMMSLMSTFYFKANWKVEFDTETTRNRVFHSPDGDVTAQFMYRDFIGTRYVGESFETTYLELEEGGEMWFILPDEDVSLQSLFSDTEAMGFITGQTQKTLNYKDYSAYMWLFLPKFDVNSKIDLADNLKNLGITNVFDTEKADFSTLTDQSIFVSSVTQSARVSIDESGCEAASVSGGTLPGDGTSQTYGFTLDRPFIFVVISDSGLPLFVGTVNRPN